MSDWKLPLPQVFVPTEEEAQILIKIKEELKNSLSQSIQDRNEERIFLCYATVAEVAEYIQHDHLWSCNSKYILLRGEQELIKAYINKHSLDESVLMAERCSDEVVLAYFKKWLVPVNVMEKLLQLKRFELIKKIQECVSLNASNNFCGVYRHVALILEKGYAELLKVQIQKYDDWLVDDVIALIQTQNEEMIRHYLTYHSLDEKAQNELVEQGHQQLIYLYHERYGFDKDVYLVVRKKGWL